MSAVRQDDLIGELVKHVHTGNPFLDLAVRAFAGRYQGQRRGSREAMPEVAGPDATDAFMIALKALPTGLFMILGTKGTGKTALTARLLELYGAQGKPMYALGMGALPSHIHPLEDLEELPNGAAVALDDTNLLFDNRSYHTDAGRLLFKLITLSRQKDLIIIGNSQQSAAVNRYLLQADALFLKPQNDLVAGYERSILMRLIAEAQSAFNGMTLEEIRQRVYAVSTSAYLPPFRGLLTYKQPTWYGTNYSKSKAGQ